MINTSQILDRSGHLGGRCVVSSQPTGNASRSSDSQWISPGSGFLNQPRPSRTTQMANDRRILSAPEHHGRGYQHDHHGRHGNELPVTDRRTAAQPRVDPLLEQQQGIIADRKGSVQGDRKLAWLVISVLVPTPLHWCGLTLPVQREVPAEVDRREASDALGGHEDTMLEACEGPWQHPGQGPAKVFLPQTLRAPARAVIRKPGPRPPLVDGCIVRPRTDGKMGRALPA